MASQRFCLRWNNHQSNLLSVFDQLFHAETFTDVTLAIDGQCLKAHKVLIIIICSSFRMLFVFHFFFFVIRKRVNQVELFIIFKSLFFSFRSFLFSGTELVESFIYFLSNLVFLKKKKCLITIPSSESRRGKCLTEKSQFLSRYRSFIPTYMWWPETTEQCYRACPFSSDRLRSG